MKPGIVLFAVVLAAAASLLPDTPDVRAGLALFVLIATLWLTEALALTFTALLVPLVAVGLGLAPVREALASFADPVIFLFLGGFGLASALSRHGLDRWLAGRLLHVSRGRPLPAALLLMLATSLLSMWISNTATAAMMLPIALGLTRPLAERFSRYRCFLLLGLAWSANIGGLATLVGSPPNAIVAAALGWGFRDWLQVGLPAWLLLFPLALAVLYVVIRPERDVPRVAAGAPEPFPDTAAARSTVAIFAATAALWVAGQPLAQLLGVTRDFDAWVAMLAIALLALTGSLTWQDVDRHTNWGVLLLFGGGITLSTLLQSSGTSTWLAAHLTTGMPADHPWLVYLMVAFFVVFLTELVSNTASAALLIPLFMPVAASVGADATVLAALIGVAASCSFMLPVATPPNALVFGTGAVSQRTMIRAGLWMNLLCATVLALLLPPVFRAG